jgi:hypothetical protein
VSSYLVAWSRARASPKKAAARGAARLVADRRQLPIRIPPGYAIGQGLMMPDSTVPPPKPPARVIIP